MFFHIKRSIPVTFQKNKRNQGNKFQSTRSVAAVKLANYFSRKIVLTVIENQFNERFK